MKYTFFLCILILLSPQKLYASPLCSIKQITTLTLHNTGYTIWTPAYIQQHPLSLIIDTGSEASLLTPHALSLLPSFQTKKEKASIIGTDGQKIPVTLIEIPSLTLNTLTFHSLLMPISPLSGIPMTKNPILGIIGMDILNDYDLEFNLPVQKLILWKIQNHSILCPNPPFWKGKWETIPLIQLKNRFLIPFKLDGYSGIALLDTGARSHILSTNFVHKMGITDDILARDPTGTNSLIGGKEGYYHWHYFHALAIGSEEKLKPILTVAPLHEKADMLLGADWFAERHIWLSTSSKALFIERY